ncbi:MAG TPA: hypothetical protein VGF99_13575, partial [Myxococcota bacterium]
MSSAPGGLLPPLDPNPQSGNSMTRVTITASIMLIVWMSVTTLTGTKKPDDKKPDAPVAAATDGSADLGGSNAAAINAADPAAAPTGTSDTLPEQTIDIAVDVKKNKPDSKVEGGFFAGVTSFGAQLKRFDLTGYYETKLEEGVAKGEHVLVNIARGTHDGARLAALKSRGGDVALKADAPYEITQQDTRSVTFSRLTPSGVRVDRRWVFNDTTFSATIETTLKNEGTTAKTAELDVVLVGRERGGERDEGGMFSPGTDILGGV